MGLGEETRENLGDAVVRLATGSPSVSRRWRFANVQFDDRTLELSVGAKLVSLERKPIGALQYLLEHAGDVVTKDELLAAVWPGRILSDTALAKCIARLRDALEDNQQEIIKTVHGYGYRLAAPVTAEVSRSTTPAHFDFKLGDHPPQRPLWNLIRKLGAGGHGEAWLVQHQKTKESRVFKFALDEGSLTALKREITLFRLLRDALGDRARIVTLLDWNLEQQPYFIEAEYAEGGSLSEWAAARGGAGTVPLAVRIEIVAQIADALAAVHSVGVLHKDLKPSNVLVEVADGAAPKVLLGDLGSGGVLDARRLEALGITRLGFTQTVNVSLGTSGTPLYLAPEVIAGQPPTVQADIYALGVLLYQMVVGDLYRTLSAGWEREVNDELLRSDIAGAAEGNPELRISSAAEVARRLRSVEERRKHLEDERRAVEQAAATALAAEKTRARRTAMVVAFAAMTAGLVTSTVLYVDAKTARNEARAAADTSRAVADFLSRDLFAVVDVRPLRELTVPELLKSASIGLTRKMGARPEAVAQIHASLGSAFWTMKMLPEAEEQLESALNHYDGLGASGAAEAATIAAQLTGVKFMLGKLASVQSHYEAILRRAQTQLGETHPATLDLHANLAQARYAVGDWRRAAEIAESLLVAAPAAGEGGYAALGMAEKILCQSRLRLAEFEQALAVVDRSIARMSAAPEASGMALGFAHELRAEVLIEVERLADAEVELAKAQVIISRWSVDNASVYVADLQHLFGRLKLRQGRTEEAISLLHGSIDAYPRVHTAEWRLYLAQAYRATGQLPRAEQELRTSLSIGEALVGSSHPLTARSLVALAEVLREQGRTSEARGALASIDMRVLNSLGADHPYRAEWARVNGAVAHDEGHQADSLQALSEAHRIFRLRYGEQHPLTHRASVELAAASPQKSRSN